MYVHSLGELSLNVEHVSVVCEDLFHGERHGLFGLKLPGVLVHFIHICSMVSASGNSVDRKLVWWGRKNVREVNNTILATRSRRHILTQASVL